MLTEEKYFLWVAQSSYGALNEKNTDELFEQWRCPRKCVSNRFFSRSAFTSPWKRWEQFHFLPPLWGPFIIVLIRAGICRFGIQPGNVVDEKKVKSWTEGLLSDGSLMGILFDLNLQLLVFGEDLQMTGMLLLKWIRFKQHNVMKLAEDFKEVME